MTEAMYSVGNLISEIFGLKNEISQQVKRSIDLHAQHLCTNLLIQGIPPPPWLLDDIRCSEAPRELNKGDVISKILQQHRQPVTHIPQARYSLCNKPFGEGNGEKAGGIVAETHSSHECFDGGHEQGAESGWVEDNPRCEVDTAPDFNIDVATQLEPLTHSPGTYGSPYNEPVRDGTEGVLAGGMIAEAHSNHECFDTGNDLGVESGHTESNNDISVFDTNITAHQQSDIGCPGACCTPNNSPTAEGVQKGGEVEEQETCPNDGDQQGAESGCLENTTTGNRNMVPEVDSNVISPHDIEVRISSIFNAQNQSVARIQRSKSRQKALELRNSAKTECRSRLNQQNHPNGSSLISRLFVCSPAENQATETKWLGSSSLSPQENCEAQEMQVGDDEYNNKKRSFSSCTGKFSGSRGCQVQSISEMDLVKGDSSACTSKKNQSTALRDAEDFQQCSEIPNLSQEVACSNVNSERSGLFETVLPEAAEKIPATYGGGSLIPTILDEAPERDIAGRFGAVDDDTVAMSPGKSMQQFDDTNEHSVEFVQDEVRSPTMSGDEGMPEFLDTSTGTGHAATKSTSGATDEALSSSDDQVILPSLDSHNAAKQLSNSKAIASDAIAIGPAILKSIPCGAGLDYSLTRPSSDYLIFLEPKQLDFDEREECNFRKSNSSVEIDQLERSTDKVPDASSHLPSTSDHDTFSGEAMPPKISIAEQGFSPKALEICGSPSDTSMKEHDDVQLEARGSTFYEYSVPENIEVDSEPYVSTSKLSCLVDVVQPKVTVEDPGSEKNSKISFGEVYGPELQEEDGITDKANLPSSADRAVGGCGLQEVEVEDSHYQSNFASESCANSEYSTQQVLDSPALREDDLPTRGSGGSPFGSLSESMGLQVSKNSVAQNLLSLKVDSWPRSKRRKIQDKETVCFSTSPSFRVKKDPPAQMDSASVRKVGDDTKISLGVASSVDKITQKEACENMEASEETEDSPRLEVKELVLTSENPGEHADTTSSPNQVGGTVFNLTEVVARYSEVCLVEETKFAGTSADRTEDSDKENNLHRMNLEGIGNLETSKDWTAEKSHLHRNSFSRLDGHLLSGFGQPLISRGLDLTLSEETMPELEGFVINQPTEDETKTSGHAINFDELELLRTSIERASILEQLCASTVSHTPSAEFSSSLKLNESSKTCQSVPNGLLECMDLRSISAFNADVTKQLKVSCMSNANEHLLQKMSHSDSLLDLGGRFDWSSRDLPRSPIGKLWERMSLHSGSSEKRPSSNPELTCFPIEEDPSSSEENENAPEVTEITQKDSIADSSAKRQPLANLTNIVAQPPIFVIKKSVDRASLDSVTTEVSLQGTYNKKGKAKVHSYCRNNGEDKEDDGLAVAASTVKNKKELTASNIRKRGLPRETSLRRKMSRLSEKKPKHSNIVSNVTSFVPFVKQKQAATVCAGKRDVKVKALEIAEAAKRLEEKKDNERKMRKEALKLERAKTEQENLRQMELNKKKKEEERKKKDADVAARKRQREEEDKKERERKRKRLEETQRMRKEGGTMFPQKVEKQKQLSDHDEKDVKSKDFRFQAGIPVEACATGDPSRHMKKSTSLDRAGSTGNMKVKESDEKSYDISPYHCSDEEEGDDELEEEERNKKFIPSWASKNCVALVLPSHQRVQPELIFPPHSFCSMNEVCTSRVRRSSQTNGQ